jgi:hypothetical protein
MQSRRATNDQPRVLAESPWRVSSSEATEEDGHRRPWIDS